MDSFWTPIIAAVIYGLIGRLAGVHYYRKRHGVYLPYLFRDVFFVGSLGLYAVGVTWPVSLFLPSVRNPELCMHPDHLLARDEARRHFERVEEALQRERGTA